MKKIKNISASVHQKLLYISKSRNVAFNELLQFYVMERFLYRLSISNFSENYILKGALMLHAWKITNYRSTMDIDLLGIKSNNEELILEQFRKILKVDIDDGLTFDIYSLRSEKITKEADYSGIRISLYSNLGNAKIKVQVDIGFGDKIFPDPQKIKFPILLKEAHPILLCYSIETAIAEKFQAMIKLGFLNSRMKDFYDIWILAKQFEFQGEILSKSIELTFKNRKTMISEKIDAFSDTFIEKKQIQWFAFAKRMKQNNIPNSFKEIVKEIDIFLSPIINNLNDHSYYSKKWNSNDKWK